MELTKQLLEELYITQGLSTKEIANKLNIGKTTVNRKLKKYEIPIRDRNSAQKSAMKKWGEEYKKNNIDSNLKCKLCNKDIYVKKSLLDKTNNHFCSISCSSKYYSQFKEKKGEYIECDYCKNIHYKNQYILQNFDKHFCCKECHNKWMSKNNIGENNPKYKRVITYCAFCGEKLKLIESKLTKNKQYHYCNRDCMSKHYVGLVYGENHPSWKGGYNNLYYGPNWKQVRKEARERDNFTCQRCGITEDALGHALPVHHIKALRKFKSWEEANVLSNLVSLCPKCHGTVEQNGMDFKF